VGNIIQISLSVLEIKSFYLQAQNDIDEMADESRFKTEQTRVASFLKKTPGSLEVSPLSSEKFLQNKSQMKNTASTKIKAAMKRTFNIRDSNGSDCLGESKMIGQLKERFFITGER
jgi:hypothetical protein